MNELNLNFLKEYEDFTITRTNDIKINICGVFEFKRTKAIIKIYNKNIVVCDGNYDNITVGKYVFNTLRVGKVENKDKYIKIKINGVEDNV